MDPSLGNSMQNHWQGVLRRHRRALGVIFALYWCAMFVATHIPLPQVDAAPQNTDKLVHLVMYAGFAFLFSLWLSARTSWSRKIMLVVLCTSIGYAALDEILQMPLESRSAEVWDFVMDLLGAAMGLGMMSAVHRRYPQLWETQSPE
jgi:VanZ family protein